MLSAIEGAPTPVKIPLFDASFLVLIWALTLVFCTLALLPPIINGSKPYRLEVYGALALFVLGAVLATLLIRNDARRSAKKK